MPPKAHAWKNGQLLAMMVEGYCPKKSKKTWAKWMKTTKRMKAMKVMKAMEPMRGWYWRLKFVHCMSNNGN